jgi:pimeloyl-ACP methyl ester carboxylesterase
VSQDANHRNRLPVPDTFEKRIFTSHDGIELAADVGGPDNAPAILMMHGGGQTRHSWSGATRRLLEEGYRVINLDLRGHGESGWSPTGQYPLSDRARDIETVLQGSPNGLALVGASLGGVTASTAVGLYGLKADALVIVDVVPHPEFTGIQRILEFMNAHPDGFADLEEAAAAVASYNPERPRPRDPKGLHKNLREDANGRLRWHWDPAILRMDHERDFQLFAQATEAIGRMEKPEVLLVRGMESDIVSDRSIATLRGMIPRVEVVDVADAGHMVAGDRNDRFNKGTIEFLRRVLPLP